MQNHSTLDCTVGSYGQR